jgi:uracil-DNA glycosylase family 4
MAVPQGQIPLFTVIGEAPGREETSRLIPFIGPSGKLLRGLMREIMGVHGEEVGWANVVSCWPNEGGKGNRTVTPGLIHQAACRGNLMEQVENIGSPFVLLVGGVALNAFRGDLQISSVHGQVYVWEGKWIVMPVYHPAFVLRERSNLPVLKADLGKWAEIVCKGTDPLDLLGIVCVKCPDTITHYDPDGVPWCKRHWEKWGGQWLKERRRWDKRDGIVRKRQNQRNQEAMF